MSCNSSVMTGVIRNTGRDFTTQGKTQHGNGTIPTQKPPTLIGRMAVATDRAVTDKIHLIACGHGIMTLNGRLMIVEETAVYEHSAKQVLNRICPKSPVLGAFDGKQVKVKVIFHHNANPFTLGPRVGLPSGPRTRCSAPRTLRVALHHERVALHPQRELIQTCLYPKSLVDPIQPPVRAGWIWSY